MQIVGQVLLNALWSTLSAQSGGLHPPNGAAGWDTIACSIATIPNSVSLAIAMPCSSVPKGKISAFGTESLRRRCWP